jgi:hypothetical protein
VGCDERIGLNFLAFEMIKLTAGMTAMKLTMWVERKRL